MEVGGTHIVIVERKQIEAVANLDRQTGEQNWDVLNIDRQIVGNLK